MTRKPSSSGPSGRPAPDLPDAALEPGETVLARLDTDLDERLCYVAGRVILTDRRLLALGPGQAQWRSWPCAPGLRLQAHDHAGAVLLALDDGERRLAAWRYTLGRASAGQRLLAQFEQQQARAAGGAPAFAPPRLCPACQAPLDAGQDDCPACDAAEAPRPVSTWALLRLWRFARPYRGSLLAGFLLTLLATAATLVPPYLTMPLMDEVLIPFQGGTPIDYDKARWYLLGLLASALLAWGLG